MSKQLLLLIAVPLVVSISVGLVFRRSLLAKALMIVLICYPLGVFALVLTHDLYNQGRAPAISRHNTSIALDRHPIYGNLSLVLHALAGGFLILGGTYFAVKRFREWRNDVSQ